MDVIDDIVGAGGVAADAAGDVVEFKGVAGAPGDVVVGASFRYDRIVVLFRRCPGPVRETLSQGNEAVILRNNEERVASVFLKWRDNASK
jgi:hypothetical protein